VEGQFRAERREETDWRGIGGGGFGVVSDVGVGEFEDGRMWMWISSVEFDGRKESGD